MQWTEKLISDSIMNVVNSTHISHMPTRNEVRSFYGNDALTNKISKTYGYYGWAEKLNLPMKQNDTLTGKIGEKEATLLLESNGYEVKQMLQNYPFDLLVNGLVKIDVKYSHLYRGPNGDFYSFALRKKYPSCDIYFLISEDGRAFIVPSKDVQQLQISIGKIHSKYEKYLWRYDIIDQLCNALSMIS